MVLQFFVPRVAAWAFITVPDEQGEQRVAARLEPRPAASEGGGETLTLPLRASDETIGALHLRLRDGEPFATGEFLHAAALRSAQALRNAGLYEREQRVSLTFQNAALGVQLPDVPGYRFDAMYEAGRAEALVGGDWYDAFRLADGRFVVSIGDVMGSGLKAAVAMVNVRQTMRGVALVHADPALMLQAADQTLRDQYPERYVTTFVAVIDPVTQNCAYANAAHPAPFVRGTDGYVQQLHGHGTPLGMSDMGAHVEVYYAHLEPDSLLVLYTDGLTEASRDVVEGELRLRKALEILDPAATDVARRIHDEVLSGPARDDVAILAVHIGAAGPVRRWRFDPRWQDVTTRVRLEISDEARGERLRSPAAFQFRGNFCRADGQLGALRAGNCGSVLRNAPGRVHSSPHRQRRGLSVHAPSAARSV